MRANILIRWDSVTVARGICLTAAAYVWNNPLQIEKLQFLCSQHWFSRHITTVQHNALTVLDIP